MEHLHSIILGDWIPKESNTLYKFSYTKMVKQVYLNQLRETLRLKLSQRLYNQ